MKHPSLLHVFLIKPSKYDEDGYVIRHWRGVLPSNTLACLQGLTEEVSARRLPGETEVRVHVVDEAVHKLPIEKMVRLHKRRGERVLAALAGVQSNQFARASDIALELRSHGIPVMLGGFHVSGQMALFHALTPDLQRLADAGVTLVAGEVEHRWAGLLKDALEDRLQPAYRFLSEAPDLTSAPLPVLSRDYLSRFVARRFGVIDCSRGCPFQCSFCTIINVQGRKLRHRSPECVAAAIRRNYREAGVRFYFFTDDNFARNPAWEAILEQMQHLREAEGIPVEFMIQADTLAHRIPGFIEKAARAGCSNVFIGMESLNPRNLKEAGKTQNHVNEYRTLIEAWHRVRVSTHVACIIGFPHDTEESVRRDLERLMEEVRPQRASFFMLMPLPGSVDYKRALEAGVPLASDFNLYDSFHQTMPHPHLEDGAWGRLYREAWERFYSFAHMKEILSEADPKNYWDIFRNLFWYKFAALSEGLHPMMSGFFRLKDRNSRRPGFAREGWFTHLRRRIPEVYRYLRDLVKLTLEMEELWLQTRRRSESEQYVLEELARVRAGLRRGLKVSEIEAACRRAKARVPSLEIPSRLTLLMERVSVWPSLRWRQTRRDLTLFWLSLRRDLRRGRPSLVTRPHRVALNAIEEMALGLRFLAALAKAA